MKCRSMTLVAICLVVVSSTATLARARSRADPPQVVAPKLERCTFKPTDLRQAGVALMHGAVLTRPLLSKTVREPGQPTAAELRSVYMVGTGEATPAQLRALVPHVAAACDHLGSPIELRDVRGFQRTASTGRTAWQPGRPMERSLTETQTQRDPLTDDLITMHKAYRTSEFRVQGGQWAEWYGIQTYRPIIWPTPPIRPVPWTSPLRPPAPIPRYSPRPLIYTPPPPPMPQPPPRFDPPRQFR